MKLSDTPTARILLDGEEFITIWGDDYLCTWNELFERDDIEWREAALLVFKPRFGGYLRERLVMRGEA